MLPTAASLLVVAGWAAGFALFAGIGELATPLVLGRAAVRTTLASFWIGFALVLAALQIWNLWLPVDARALLCAAPFALAGLLLLARRLPWRMPRPGGGRDAVASALCALLVLWASRRALLGPLNGDVCAYHLQAVRWASCCAIVPGLGNLSYLLGRNSSYPLYVALLDAGPFFHRAQHLANGLLFLGVALPALARTLDLFGPAPRRSSLLWALAFGLALDQLFGQNLSSPAADGAMWSLLTLTILWALEPILDRTPMTEARVRLVLATALSGVLVKVAFVLAGALFSLFAIADLFRGTAPKRSKRLTAFVAALSLLVVLPWIARGIIVSGVPFFPAMVGDLNLEWRIPASTAAGDREDFDSYNKYQRDDFVHGRKRGPWVAGWLKQEWLSNRTFLIPAAGWLTSLAALAALLIARRRIPPLSIALVPLGLFAAIWFALFPDTRFIGPLLWIGAAVTILCADELTERPSIPHPGRQALAILAVLLVDAGALPGIVPPPFELPADFQPPPPESYFEASLKTGETVHQIRVCCYEPPCALDASHLATRRHGDFSSGFISR